MTDINFFEPYILEKEKSSSSNTFIVAVSCVAVTAAAGSLGYNTYTMAKYNRDIINLETQLNDTAFKEKYVEATAIANEKQILTTYDSTLRDIYTSMKNRAMVKNELMTELYGTVPGGVLFKNVTIKDGAIAIAGAATSENAIAELQYNINNLPFISASHVPSITSDLEELETFTFSIVCAIKEEYYENK